MSFSTLDVEETKLKGVVHTEKPIASFMCRLSLYAYLLSNFHASTDNPSQTDPSVLANLVFDRKLPEVLAEDLSKIKKLLFDVKVMDPAVGLGVFLSTIMDEIVDLISLMDADCDHQAVAEHLVKNALHGVDINEEAVMFCRKTLNSKLPKGAVSCGNRHQENIIVADSLFDLGEKYRSGFDIVICNPPYVRQEILPGGYKAKLQKHYPELAASSDLFAYFFLCASTFLKPGGAAVFISPVSWLGVQYGTFLQRFIMQHMPCSAVFYSDIEKWFPSASVSTCISLHTAARIPDAFTYFVNFKKSLEYFLEKTGNRFSSGSDSGSVFSEILAQNHGPGLEEKEDYRLYCVNQKTLSDRDMSDSVNKSYKWVMYLRAPEICYQLQSIFSGKLIPFQDMARITRGYTTGCNRFFYVKTLQRDSETGLDQIESLDSNGIPVTFHIEASYLKPLVKSPREVKGYKVKEDELSYSVLLVRETDRDKLEGRKVLEYIEWGEEQGYNSRSTLRRNPVWWCLPKLLPAQVLFRQFYDTRFNLPLNEAGFAVDHTFYYPVGCENSKVLGALVNSTIVYFFLELFGRVNQSDGVLTCYGPELRSLNIPLPGCFEGEMQEELLAAYDGLCRRYALPIFDEVECEDRIRLDHVVLKGLGVCKKETRDALLEDVYCDLAGLVKNRVERVRK